MHEPDLRDVSVTLSQVGVDLVGEMESESLGVLDEDVEGPLYYVDADSLNLNALAIGLGLEHIEFEPELFPGLVFRVPDHDCTVYLFEEGVIATWTAADRDVAEAALGATAARLTELGLSDVGASPTVEALSLR
jgi:transcription initiation factor TFIID TATA-box-binding protein